MAVGMTLNQLYAPPSTTTSCVPDSVPLSVTAAALSPPQGHYSPPSSTSRDPHKAHHNSGNAGGGAMQQMDRMYQMSYPPAYSLQYSHPSTTASTATATSTATTSCSTNGMLFQPLSKPGPSTSEDYAADPLPFEYSRKYAAPPLRDDGGSSSLVTSSFNDSYASPHNMYAPGPCATPQQQQPPPVQRGTTTPGVYGHHPHYSEAGRGGAYPTHHTPHHNPHPHQPVDMATSVPYPQFRRATSSSSMYSTPMPNSLLANHHAFPPLLDAVVITKKEVEPYAPHSPSPVYSSDTRTGGGPAQEAMIKVKTPLKLKYWRNGRRNLQCFPSCKVFGDYSAIKIEDLKQHDFMWGKCRGSLVAEVSLNSRVGLDDLVLLGRVHSLENVPAAFEEAVIRECMLGRTIARDEMEAMKDQWIVGERLPDFGHESGHVACFEFKPKVWKYTEDMAQGKCKRRNVKYYVQFEAFVHIGHAGNRATATATATTAAAAAAGSSAGDRRYYACIGSGMSTSFEVGSSRVLARQKRKAATCAADASVTSADLLAPPPLLALNSGTSHSLLHHHHGMATGSSAHAMYAPATAYASHHDAQARSLPPTFPHPQMMMHPMALQPEVGHYSLSQQQQQQLSYRQAPVEPSNQLSSSQLSVGDKRKTSSDRPAFLTDRSVKMLKVMSGVPQSVPI